MENEFLIHKPKPLIYISNDLTKRERLIFNFLIKLVNTQIKKENPKYEFRLGNIKNVCNIRDFEAIRGILFNFLHLDLEVNILKDKKILKPIENIVFTKSNIEITFTNEFINLFEVSSYATINIKNQKKLNSKYSIVLYEIINDYYRESNHFMQIPHIEINLFKELMGFKNISNYDLEKIVLRKVVEDINKNSEFNLDYNFLNKNGSKKTTHIEFRFSKEKLPKKISNEEILKQIKKERELLDAEKALMGERRFQMIKQEIQFEETIKKYEKVMKEFDNRVNTLENN